MSTPIKPPGTGSVQNGAPTENEGPEASSGAREKFSQAVEQAQKADAPTEGQGIDVVTQVAEQLQTGSIDAPSAVQRLVEHAVLSNGGAMLSETQQAELKAWIEASLEDDPTLQALLNDLKS
ncbi:MAG: hypothetical protein IPJ88_01345 [Myxococcales bacterium]|nr:MAG: hypothetical protein IPJ88_01345 [Myxococcales bacterium]